MIAHIMGRDTIARAGQTCAVMALSAAIMLPAGDAAAQIGTVAAVNQRMDGTPPEKDKRQLFLKDPVVANERVQTTDDGSGQLLFVDQTSLTVAPNSDIFLDKYVFDPEKQEGDMAISLTKGAVRFIGGAITKGTEATIRTPTSTIGIRGGMVIVQHEAGQTTVTNVASISVTVTTYGDADGDGLDDGPGGAAGDGGDTGGTSDGGDTGSTGGTTGGTTGGQTGSSGDTGGGGGDGAATSTVTLTRPSSTATSDQNGVTYTGITNADALTQVFGTFEGSGTGGFSGAPDGDTTQSGTDQVAATNSGQTGGTNNDPVLTTGGTQAPEEGQAPQDDPNSDGQEEGSVGQVVTNTLQGGPPPQPGQGPVLPPIVSPPMATLTPADPMAVAQLTGTAAFFGTASGTVTDTTGVAPAAMFNGDSALIYDFAQRAGILQLDIPAGLFTTGVEALPNNAAEFSGNSPVFGGPDMFNATGGFMSSPQDVAAAVDGTFNLNLGTQSQTIVGTYEAGQ